MAVVVSSKGKEHQDGLRRHLIRRDQLAEDHQAILAKALIEGEESGVSPRKITDILQALTVELADRMLE